MVLAIPDRMAAALIILHAYGSHPSRLKARDLRIPEKRL
jgi:glucan phosphoethanolaminetransferase (alkaline phosphatase superfamily)